MMRFKREGRQGFIKAPEEKEKRPLYWGRYIYFGICILIIGILARWGYERLLYIRGLGIISVETTSLAGEIDGRIAEIKCKINDRIYKGQPIVFLDNSELKDRIATKERELAEKSGAFKLKILDTKNKLMLLKERRKNIQREVGDLQKEYKMAENLITLGVITTNQSLDIRDRLKSAKRELSTLSTEITLTAAELAALEREYYKFTNKMKQEIEQLCNLSKKTILYTPNNGVVTMVYKREGEVVKASEPILEIADISQGFIKAYFDGSDEEAIGLGDEVLIITERGDRFKGKIRKIYPTTLPLPPEYKRPEKRELKFIVAEILPMNGKFWNRVVGTRIKVLLRRDWFRHR